MGPTAISDRESVDTYRRRAYHAPMKAKTKRTYNLSEVAISRVRELAGRYEAAPSQDKVVELAIERLYRDVRDREEAEAWAKASEDPDFRAEMELVARDLDERDSWPA